VDGEMTLEQLSERTGEPVEALRRWRRLGIIDSEAEGLGPEDEARVALTQLGLRRGIELKAIAQAFKEGLLGWHSAELTVRERTYSLTEAAELLDMDAAPLRRIWAAADLGEWAGRATEADLAMLRSIKIAMAAGFSEDALTQLVRVLSDGMGKVAEAETRLFRFYLVRPMQERGLSGAELLRAIENVNEQTVPLMEPAILFFHRKGRQRAALEDAAVVMAEVAGLQGEGPPGQMQLAVVFVDLSSFTPLTEAMGDEKAVEVLQRFSSCVRESVSRWDGRVVKQIGDAFMLVFPDARSAVACALEIESRTAGERQFPAARSGVHWGKVLYREGDYVGSNVNMASRVAAEAERHQVLLTAATRQAAKGLEGVEFVRLGKRRVKGLPNEVVLFEARMAGGGAREIVVDPVCGMEMGPGEAAATLALEGEEKSFCSDECLRRYVRSPERYRG
jgi:adenylate cyclase